MSAFFGSKSFGERPAGVFTEAPRWVRSARRWRPGQKKVTSKESIG